MSEGCNCGRVTLWVARITSIITLGFIFAFLIGNVAGGFPTEPGKILLFAFFPIAVGVGMVLGWWRPLAGGITAAVGLAGFYVLHLIQSGTVPQGPWFLLFSLPGLIFLAGGLMKRAGK
jgi:hypothetical protein